MCEQYVEQGVRTVVATPHMGGESRVTPEAVRRLVNDVSQGCIIRRLQLEILPGGDICLDPALLEALAAGRVLTLADSGKYLLLEMPSQVVPRIEELVFGLRLHGITPILSHPERNLEFGQKPKLLAELVEGGCLVQLTASSLLGYLGSAAMVAAQAFLESGLVHVLASDAHSSHSPRLVLDEVAEFLMASVGYEETGRLLHDNPAKIIKGEPVGGSATQRNPGSRTQK